MLKGGISDHRKVQWCGIAWTIAIVVKDQTGGMSFADQVERTSVLICQRKSPLQSGRV